MVSGHKIRSDGVNQIPFRGKALVGEDDEGHVLCVVRVCLPGVGVCLRNAEVCPPDVEICLPNVDGPREVVSPPRRDRSTGNSVHPGTFLPPSAY